MPYLKLPGDNLYFTMQGKKAADKASVVLIHGAGGTHLDWPPQLRKIDGVVVYGLDLPGHGRSNPPGRDSIDDYAAVVVAFIGALQLKNAVLIGHSMGGAIVQTIGLHPPQAVKGMVIIGSGARLRVSEAILGQLPDKFDAVIEQVTAHAWSVTTPAQIVTLGRENLRKSDPQTLAGDFQACNNFDIMDQVGEINLPTLVLSATSDRLTPYNYGRFLCEQLPNARLCTVHDAGHMMTLEQPDLVTKAIIAFLEELDSNQQIRLKTNNFSQ